MKPFLKWAGNKYQIINRIQEILPTGNRLIEPFAGSCAVFLNTYYQMNMLSDSNPELINTYHHLQKEGLAFISYCQSFFKIDFNHSETYYEFRHQFNNLSLIHI